MKFLSKIDIRQFLQYFVVGGISAIVEWVGFWAFESLLSLNLYVSTYLSFLFSTTTNWFFGRKTAFKKDAAQKKMARDIAAVFLVSGIGLFANLILMHLFVAVFHWIPFLSKVFSTGIVFLWNFLSRKFLIYR